MSFLEPLWPHQGRFGLELQKFLEQAVYPGIGQLQEPGFSYWGNAGLKLPRVRMISREATDLDHFSSSGGPGCLWSPALLGQVMEERSPEGVSGLTPQIYLVKRVSPILGRARKKPHLLLAAPFRLGSLGGSETGSLPEKSTDSFKHPEKD